MDVNAHDSDPKHAQSMTDTSQWSPVIDPSLSDEQKEALLKRAFVIRELVETERDYVHHLGLVVDGYMAQLQHPQPTVLVPEELRNGKDKIIFGNIQAIYEWHKE